MKFGYIFIIFIFFAFALANFIGALFGCHTLIIGLFFFIATLFFTKVAFNATV